MNHEETFLLIRSDRRTLAIEVKPDASLVVRAPRRTPVEQIQRFIVKHDSWIERKQKAALTRPRPAVKTFTDGEEFLYLGKRYVLLFSGTSSPEVSNDGNSIIVKTSVSNVRDAIVKWYKVRAREVFKAAVEQFSGRMACRPSVIRITGPRRRWGSCGAGGSLNFNWKAVMAPEEVTGYLVVHELAHIKYRSHSREFWAFVKIHCPEYRRWQLWLKENGHLLEI